MRIRCLLLMFKVKADTSHYEQSLLNSLKLRVINYHYRIGLSSFVACTVKEYMFIQLQRGHF